MIGFTEVESIGADAIPSPKAKAGRCPVDGDCSVASFSVAIVKLAKEEDWKVGGAMKGIDGDDFGSDSSNRTCQESLGTYVNEGGSRVKLNRTVQPSN